MYIYVCVCVCVYIYMCVYIYIVGVGVGVCGEQAQIFPIICKTCLDTLSLCKELPKLNIFCFIKYN